MKNATVAELRNNFAAVSKWIQAGEAVTIAKRGRPATLAPAQVKRTDVAPLDRMARLRETFPNGPMKGNLQDILDYDRDRE